MSKVALEVKDLVKKYPVKGGLTLTALDGISFTINPGETLGLVGESGSGKSTAAKCILRMETPTAGQILFNGADLAGLSMSAMRKHRPKLTMVFQDPLDSLNPRMSVGYQVKEPLLVSGFADQKEAEERAKDLFVRVGLKPSHMNRYPHQLSGGQQQRVGIARALITEPKVVVLDEPTSALDVSVQAKLVNLLGDLQAKEGHSYLFISHDLAVVNLLATRVAVLYLGQIVEYGTRAEIYGEAYHPYTLAMMSAIAGDNPLKRPRERIELLGEIPSPINLPVGCRLASRCPFATPDCHTTPQVLTRVGPDHWVACHRAVAGEIPRAVLAV